MSDELDLIATGTNLVTGAGGATLVGALMRWLHGRDQAKAETTLAVLVEKVNQIAELQKKHDTYGERLALVEQSAKRAHERLDQNAARRKT